jgi:hypothetical protein
LKNTSLICCRLLLIPVPNAEDLAMTVYTEGSWIMRRPVFGGELGVIYAGIVFGEMKGRMPRRESYDGVNEGVGAMWECYACEERGDGLKGGGR